MLDAIFESDYTAQYKGRPMEQWKQEVADRTPRINDRRGAMLTYVLPFKADEIYYAETYGVRARDVVDLYSTYYRYMDYKHTAQALLKVMMDSDPEVDLDKTARLDYEVISGHEETVGRENARRGSAYAR